ncbi:MAG: DUF6290 family protein [Patescibacteria group bacterium]|jgi:hypothetical protein|nr:DUF6290 family protein [Patescibacteria group bacterium]
MTTLSDKTTIYLDPKVKKFLKHKAIAEGRSVSDLINEQFADMLEDLYDIKEVEKRRNEDTVSFEDVLKDLGLTYEQIRS